MNINTTILNGKKIRYSDHGKGTPIVMLHGFTECIEIWDTFNEELSKHHRVICIEIPGHGKSELIREIQTMELVANHIHLLLKQLNTPPFVMIGHSMGGYITLSYAEMYPEELLGVGLFHSHALADSDEEKNGRERTVEIIKQNRNSFIFNFIPALFSESNRDRYQEEIHWLRKGAEEISKESLIACLRGMAARTDKLDFLISTSIPILFILGKEDGRVSYQSALAQASLAQHAEILLLSNCGHMGYIEKSTETLKFIQSFVSNIG